MTSLKTGLARLEKLADYLENLPRKRFLYGVWATDSNLNECGTVGCALGHACNIPSFRRAGLSLQKLTLTPVMKKLGLSGFSTAEALFGISGSEATYLFMPRSSGRVDNRDYLPDFDGWLDPTPKSTATPKQVAKHIRRFVAWKRAHT